MGTSQPRREQLKRRADVRLVAEAALAPLCEAGRYLPILLATDGGRVVRRVVGDDDDSTRGMEGWGR